MFNKEWFLKHQKSLIWFANNWFGKKILCIDGKKSSVGKNKIIKIAPNAITWVHKQTKKKICFATEFRGHNKFSKRLFYAFYPVWWLMHQWDLLIANQLQPAWNLGFDTLTKFPDPNPETNTVDGYAYVTGNASWATQIAAAGEAANDVAASDTPNFFSATTTSNQWNTIVRGIYLFDTAAIPDTDTIDATTFSLWITAISFDSFAPSTGIVGSTPASNTGLVAGDYNQVASTRYATDVAWSGITINQYTVWTFNATGLANVSKTGITKLGTKVSADIDASSYTWASNANDTYTSYFADQTGTDNDPKLVVTHSVAAGGAAFFGYKNLTGVGI